MTTTITTPEIVSAIEAGAVASVQSLVTDVYGPTASAAALKLMQDVIALAGKPSLSAALADIPDALAAIEALDAAPANPAAATS